MAYNFKNLADVELLSAMPESANVLVEVDGTTKRAPKSADVDVSAELVAKEALTEVPENAEVLGVVNGEIKRIPGSGLGGNKTLVVKHPDFDNAVAGIAPAVTIMETIYTANMTFEEAVTAFMACELNSAYVYIADGSTPSRKIIGGIYYDSTQFVTPCLMLSAWDWGTLYWTAENGISSNSPESA